MELPEGMEVRTLEVPGKREGKKVRTLELPEWMEVRTLEVPGKREGKKVRTLELPKGMEIRTLEVPGKREGKKVRTLELPEWMEVRTLEVPGKREGKKVRTLELPKGMEVRTLEVPGKREGKKVRTLELPEWMEVRTLEVPGKREGKKVRTLELPEGQVRTLEVPGKREGYHQQKTLRNIFDVENKMLVIRLDLHDDKDKMKALKTVANLLGVDSVSMDMKEKKLTVIGTADPVNVVSKLRKFWHAEIISIGPAKEPGTKKEEPKKEGKQKELMVSSTKEPKKEKEEPKVEGKQKELMDSSTKEPDKKKEEPKKEGKRKELMVSSTKEPKKKKEESKKEGKRKELMVSSTKEPKKKKEEPKVEGKQKELMRKIDEKHVLKNDFDAKSKGGPSRCGNQRDVDEASKRQEEILNQSEDADEKGALVTDVDVNRRMVEQIPYAVAESLFNRLASTTFREHVRIYGIMDELERLKNCVGYIKAVLPDAEKKQEQDCVVQNWITSLKVVLHLADDLLDEFIIEGISRYKVDAGDKNQVTWVHSSSSSHNFLHQKMATEIEKIQQKFDDVLEEMAKLKLSPKAVVVKQTDSLRRKSISFLLESDIIGREDDKKEIINLLGQPHGNISSIAIIGIGGIGKTTLAQFVYNDVEVQSHFEKRMWVCVSNNFDVKTIVKKMLESLIDSKIDAKFLFEYIQHKLRENLTGERYLLVLDGICNDSHVNWTQLRTYLMCGSKDSKVLMTTRCTIVSKIPEASNPYVLNGLTLDVSWSMLKKIIFGKEISGVNQKLESIGKKIADKCNGVPLAIRTLGGLLQSKSEEREWINVLQRDFWKLDDDKENIMLILKLSYQNLSLRLKQCFAYCSLYPKDWEIKKDLLIQLWMAQGYLDCADEKTLMEDVGNEFVKIFLMKSFFQDAKVGEDGDIVSFKMHDLMHDLATQAAGNDCCYLDRETKIRVQRPIHVSFEPSAVHLLDSLDASRMRTLILLSSNEGEELNGDELSVLSKFKHLRVLKLSYCSLSKLSSSIGELNHLRYLSLSHCRGLGSLYESINSLVLLQTLILTPKEKFELSAEVVSKLINLRHLHISNWKASKEETPSEFLKLSNLKYEGMVFSNWLSPFTNIVEISFFLCGNLQYLPPLERLPFLKSLHISFLEELEYMCYEQDFTSAFFPSLESLSLQFCYKFRGWWRMGDDFNNSNSSQKLSLPPFPRLSQLSIIGCQMLTCMPAFPNLDNRLELYNSCVETLVATMNMVALESLNHSLPLSMLKSLHIDGVSLDVKRIPNDWMQNLTSLQLQISWFSCQAIQGIETWFKDDLKCLPSLQTIAFHNCEDLEALPDWICNLSSLQHLRVHDCINLASLPEGMPCLTNLQTLEIIGCPLLDEECQTQTDETWPKIRHVPKIILSSLH